MPYVVMVVTETWTDVSWPFADHLLNDRRRIAVIGSGSLRF